MSDLTEKQRHVINLAADVIDAHTTNHKLANSLRGILQSLDARRTQPEATAPSTASQAPAVSINTEEFRKLVSTYMKYADSPDMTSGHYAWSQLVKHIDNKLTQARINARKETT